jgi:hypothetical protein
VGLIRLVSPPWQRSAISTRSASDSNRGEIVGVVEGPKDGTKRTVPSLRHTS